MLTSINYFVENGWEHSYSPSMNSCGYLRQVVLLLLIDGELELLLTIRKQLEASDMVLDDPGKWAWEGRNCHRETEREEQLTHC